VLGVKAMISSPPVGLKSEIFSISSVFSFSQSGMLLKSSGAGPNKVKVISLGSTVCSPKF